MQPERFRQIRNVFDAAVEREGPDRTTFLVEACHGDEELRSEVDRLLAAHARQTDFLESPAAASAPGWNRRMEGRRIGPYEILRELGSGGMGTVYLAARADSAFRRLVAIKIMDAESANGEFTRRFHQEREILATLDHPNIATLFDGGTTEDDRPFFVMEFVDGVPIDRYCDDRKLSVADRLTLFRQVCAAIDYAHQQGVIHRDLKPQNIFVTAGGTVKLLDFGIAKAIHKRESDSAALTSAGMRLMTPEYASPEQVRGEPVDASSDLYSLGIVLYELLTGHRPYRLRSRIYHEIVRVICEEPPAKPSTAVMNPDAASLTSAVDEKEKTADVISRLRCGTPGELRKQLSGNLDSILLKALRKEPAARYASAAEFGEDLGRHLSGEGVKASAGNVRYALLNWMRQYQMWILAVAILAAGFGTGAIRLNIYGVLFVAIVFPSVLTGYFMTRVQLGREIALKRMRWFIVFMICNFALAIALTRLPHPEWIIASTMTMAACWGMFYLARWKWRDSWGGALLLDLSLPLRESPLLPIVSVFAVVTQIAALGAKAMEHAVRVPDIIYTGTFVLLFAVTAVFANRAELRQKGLVAQGRLIRWNRIGSYSWRTARHGKRMVILKIRSGLLAYLPGAQLLVHADKEQAVTGILDRYLSEWPPQ